MIDPLDDAIELSKGAKAKAKPAAPVSISGRRWSYKMVPIPLNVYVGEKATMARHVDYAAKYLEEAVNLQCMDGWEFFKIEPITTMSTETPGFLAELLGDTTRVTELVHYIMVFRRET